MPALVTEQLEIDTAAVQAEAIRNARADRDYHRKQAGRFNPNTPPAYRDLLRMHLRRMHTMAGYRLAEAVERDRLGKLSAAEREREELLTYRDRITNPATRPFHFGISVGGDTAALTSEVERIDARLASLPSSEQMEAA
ncbi:hypothetical protein ABLE91_05595 [Aquabacter sp. CN5-332]|uniref:hypothetical protein n=1 Tax=Aquabacter sp. CN5-332 TaxID=3156608 RepID=UPI0032B5D4CA